LSCILKMKNKNILWGIGYTLLVLLLFLWSYLSSNWAYMVAIINILTLVVIGFYLIRNKRGRLFTSIGYWISTMFLVFFYYTNTRIGPIYNYEFICASCNKVVSDLIVSGIALILLPFIGLLIDKYLVHFFTRKPTKTLVPDEGLW
jgi:hypothetical protein